MKKLSLLLALMLVLSSCTQTTPYGKCIGVMDKESEGKEYAISWWNSFVGIIFVETLIVPTVTILWDIKCPVGSSK